VKAAYRLVGGAPYYLGLRYGRQPRPTEPYKQAQFDAMRWLDGPMILSGLIGAVLWIVAALQ
jgi:hypothetical protein